MGTEGSANAQIGQARTEHSLQEESIAKRDQAIAGRNHLLDLASAQLAILIAHDEFARPGSIEERLSGGGENVETILSPKEIRALSGARFVVQTIFKATET